MGSIDGGYNLDSADVEKTPRKFQPAEVVLKDVVAEDIPQLASFLDSYFAVC